MADTACIARVAGILGQCSEPRQIVVVSAMRGVTDALIELGNRAAAGDHDWPDAFAALRQRHLETAEGLLGEAATSVCAELANSFARLQELLHALAVLETAAPDVLERIQGLGETWSARLLAARLNADGKPCALLDAREVLTVSHRSTGVIVDWSESARRLADWRAAHPEPWVVATGFVARTAEGRATILGRNGSDFSGAIFARLFDADSLTLWGDTDGVLSADPRLVPEAVPLTQLSTAEACELAYFGARVIHPQALTPVLATGIPVRIRNTFHPEAPGTRIESAPCPNAETPVKGVSHLTHQALLTIEGSGMIGVPGSAERAFGALRADGISVSMISQGSSEHSICCVVRGEDAERAREALLTAFAGELARGEIQNVQVSPPISVLAAVGDGMVGTIGVSARLLGALAHSGVNVRAIAQGASERNISIAVAAEDATRALRAAHSAFWLSPQTISIGLIGPGNVGAALLQQIEAARTRLRKEANLDLRVRAVSSSKRMWLGEAEDASDWKALATDTVDPQQLARHVHAEHLPHAVILDCSASPEVADCYADWLQRGIHVATPNKHAGSGSLDRYRAIREAASDGARFRYEATVGAGLPVIQTLRDLLDTGDQLLAVEGIFSGTLAWLFNRYDGSMRFSELVREAHRLGYTEPDPRDDLSGTDVARKLVILAREAGWNLELEQVSVESLVPEALASLQRDAFLDQLGAVDDAMAERLEKAREQGCVLRYVAKLDSSGRTAVGLVPVPADHAFAHLRLTDNVVQFTTARYRDNPLVVQGPGAGLEVTAAGVFADLLRIAAGLGARL